MARATPAASAGASTPARWTSRAADGLDRLEPSPYRVRYGTGGARPRAREVVRRGARRPARPRRRGPRRRPGGGRRGARALGHRQVHSAAPARRPRPRGGRLDRGGGRGRHARLRGGAVGAAPAPRRLRLPVLPPPARALGRGQRPARRPGPRRAPRRGGARTGADRPPRIAPCGRLPAPSALGRRAAALRDRPRAGQRPRRPARRRADRQPRRGGRRRGPPPAARGRRRGARGGHGHPRGGRDADGRPRAGPARRQARVVVSLALAGLRARGRRTLLAAAGVLAAAIVAGTGTTVGYGLATGFERSAAKADLPDVIARFDSERRGDVAARVQALPNLAGASYRDERLNSFLAARGHVTQSGAVETVYGERHGYDVVDGHDLTSAPGEVIVERGLAREWGLRPGDRLDLGGGMGELTVVGVAVSPDNVAYPLAKAARVYVGTQEVQERLGFIPDDANVALLWLNDPARADVTLTQARAVSFGLGRLQFITRDGVRILLSQAAGIVISLLVAFSLVALVAAGTMLVASAHADVQRRLSSLGVQHALGFTPGALAARQAGEAAVVAAPAAALGMAVGAVAVSGPAADLLAALNELGPGWALLGPLALAWAVVVLIVVAAGPWPAWRAARRPPVEILRGGEPAGLTRRARGRGL